MWVVALSVWRVEELKEREPPRDKDGARGGGGGGKKEVVKCRSQARECGP